MEKIDLQYCAQIAAMRTCCQRAIIVNLCTAIHTHLVTIINFVAAVAAAALMLYGSTMTQTMTCL